jgi:dihydrofolate reductase
MAKVVWDVSMSLDGFIADPKDSPGKIFDWYFNGDTPSAYSSESLPFKLSSDDAKVFDEGTRTVGAVVAGRRTYNFANAWEGSFFVPVPFFVLTHKPPREVPKGTTKFTFVTDGIESAIKQAGVAAGDNVVSIMGANTAKQCIEAGLLDELRVHVTPSLLGDGVRLFDHLGTHWVELERTRVIASSSGVAHIQYRIIK